MCPFFVLVVGRGSGAEGREGVGWGVMEEVNRGEM